ncbi:MAG: S8 family serine peptidase [Bdellovibrionota bacterium]
MRSGRKRITDNVSAQPPQVQEHHVRLPEQVASLLKAQPLHAQKVTGLGVSVAVIDSGFYPHPFYQALGYRIRHIPTSREPDPHVDEYGHGTAQLASLFAVAPEAEVLAIKCMDRDPSHALEVAIDLKPQVISCAWGFNIDHPDQRGLPSEFRKLYRLIMRAVDQGITVVAAGGNGQYSFPASIPEVIAAGGVYYSPDGNFDTSDVSSKFTSSLFPGRQVPDVCGLVGRRPHGRLLLVPIPPRAKLARRTSFATIAAGESADVKKGWAIFSGTSAATAMISGASALLYQVTPGLSPAQIKRVLVESARLITPTRERLLDAEAALRMAQRLQAFEQSN